MVGKLLQYVIKLEKFEGGIKMDEIILKDFFAENVDMAAILGKCKEAKELIDIIPAINDEFNRQVEDSIYFGSTYTSNI